MTTGTELGWLQAGSGRFPGMCVFSPHSGAITAVSLLMSMCSIASQALCVCVFTCICVCVSPPQEERLTGDCDCTLGRFRFSMSIGVDRTDILSLPRGLNTPSKGSKIPTLIHSLPRGLRFPLSLFPKLNPPPHASPPEKKHQKILQQIKYFALYVYRDSSQKEKLIIYSFIHFHFLNLYDFLFSTEHKRRC